MSFATLSGTLDECSLISKLEVTKNPFDSVDDRLNLPAMSSPSIFSSKQLTPGSQKQKEFRWSIDQMSKLNPADIDEFPNQEYSSTYERPEDEVRAQEAINEYFSRGTILPSPWTPENHVKHVTFSPLPPATTYILSGDDDSMTDLSHTSSNTSGRQTMDASCQTSLTFEPSFDLSKIIDSGFYSYVEEQGTSDGRDLNVSSLRRKLFSQDDGGSPVKPAVVCEEKATRSILKSASPVNLFTSSPLKSHRHLHPDLQSTFSSGSKSSLSPAISPIKPQLAMTHHNHYPEVSASERDGTLSNEEVFTSDVFESSDVCINPAYLPDVSPIKDPGANSPGTTEPHHDGSEEEHGEEQNHPDQNDGGPMKLSELSSRPEMDWEQEDPNNNSEMEIAELLPSTLTEPAVINHGILISNSDRTGNQSAKHDVVSGGDVTDDVRVEKYGGHELIADDVCYDVGDDVSDDVDDDVGDDVSDEVDDDVGDDVDGDVAVALKEIRKYSPASNFGGLCEESKNLNNTEIDNVDNDGHLRCRGVKGDNWGSNGDNIDGGFHGDNYVNLNDFGKETEEALFKRATAAMRRADKLVLETSMEQGKIPKKTGTSNGFLNWSHIAGTSQWHPIDMSTPVVTAQPLVLKTAGSSAPRRQFRELDSYNNLLSSFANSRLDQGPRSCGPASQDSGLGTILSSESGPRNRARTMGLEARTRRSLTDLRNLRSPDSHRDTYLSGRYGYGGPPSKRSSWPPWKSSRNHRYLNSRAGSPTSPCVQRRLRHRATEERSKIRRSDEFKRFKKPIDYHMSEKYADYFDGMHSCSRKNHNYISSTLTKVKK